MALMLRPVVVHLLSFALFLSIVMKPYHRRLACSNMLTYAPPTSCHRGRRTGLQEASRGWVSLRARCRGCNAEVFEVPRRTYNVVDRDVDELDKVADEAHDHESHSNHPADLEVL